jgi:cysteine-rich repeat protein
MKVAIVALVVVGVAGDVPEGMTDAAMRAADEKRYCDASFIFLQVYEKTRSDLALYRAAETAWAADDRQLALRLYRSLLTNHPQAEKRETVEKRVVDLRALMQKSGSGTACVQPPPTCGDWIVAPGEGCDDGNLVDGDGCDATCRPTGCGNGTRSIGEQCDDGNAIEGDGCDSNCTPSACGNGVKGPSEMCDDGNANDGDTCTAQCTFPPDESTSPSPVPWLTTGAGALLFVGGGVASGVATIPILQHENALVEIETAEANINDDAAGSLRTAQQAQQRQIQATRDWNVWGQGLMIAGIATASVGVVVTGVGAWLLLAEEP